MGSQEDLLRRESRDRVSCLAARTRRRRRSVAHGILAAMFVVAAMAAKTSSPAQPAYSSPYDFTDQVSYRVKRVIDGDTLELVMAGREVRVRLVGIDTPERERAGRRAEPYAHEATAVLRKLCENRAVYVEYDALCARKDRYGRTLAHLFRAPDGLWLNREMVRLGMSPVYDKYPFSFVDDFRLAECEARATGAGIWSEQSTRPAGRDGPENGVMDQVYVSATGRAYHRSDCRSLRGTRIEISREEARRRGLRACANCQPDDR